jgi:hypothetical protein
MKQHNNRAEVYARDFQRLLARAPRVSRQDQIKLFMVGLSPTLSVEVRRDQPRDLSDAIGLAREAERQEDLLLAKVTQATRSRQARSSPWAGSLDASVGNRQAAPSVVTLPAASVGVKTEGGRAVPVGSQASVTASSAPPYRCRLSSAEMSERKEKGLCYNCDEVYSRGHRCQRLFHLEVLSEDEEDDVIEEEPTLSALAMHGSKTSRTMPVILVMGQQRLVGLVDSGSTHNFISSHVASLLQVPQLSGTKQQVQVANGARLPCLGRLAAVQFGIQDHSFSDSFLVIPLEGFDAVLEVQWLQKLGDISWNFDSLQMSFFLEGGHVSLQGLLHHGKSVQLRSLEVGHDLRLQGILDMFKDLFQEPQGLPPSRPCDHRICLKEGSDPVVVRPCRYPHRQKDEIERQCTEMLAQGIIRPSRSPFSSPVLLVRKADGSWHFCVDYRELNATTIKDKFPIPVVEELLDELHGAQFFTKLDLRSGYHQVRMHQADVEKTAFRTHHGHFEFLVMAFGLCNAPSTFQALMNEVLSQFLHKFVLVFFDDILVYSRT